MEVAVPAFPARHLVARLRVHLHVEREQVVAALEPVTERVLDEVVGLLALAHQAALHVGEGADDGVDRPGLDLCLELLACQQLPPPVPRRRTAAASLCRRRAAMCAPRQMVEIRQRSGERPLRHVRPGAHTRRLRTRTA